MKGPTGKYPHGKMDDTDRGEVGIAFRVVNGMLVMDFGTELTWFAMSRKEAEMLLARLLIYLKQGV